MSTNSGRGEIWASEVWAEIDKAVKEEWKQRVVQTVIKTVPMMEQRIREWAWRRLPSSPSHCCFRKYGWLTQL